MKSFAHKLLALTFIAALSVGCASSITDAGLSQQPEKTKTERVTQTQPDTPTFGTEADVSPIVDRPE